MGCYKRYQIIVLVALLSFGFSTARYAKKAGGKDYTQDPACEFAVVIDGTLNDLSPNNRDLSDGGATWTNDRFGIAKGALEFDANNDYMQVTTDDIITSAASIVCWYYWEDSNPDDTWYGIVCKRTNTDWNDTVVRWVWQRNNVTEFMRFESSSGDTKGVADYDLSTDSWHHLVVTQTGIGAGGVMKVYHDGVLVTTDDSMDDWGDATGAPVVIGNGSPLASTGFGGKLAEVAVFSRVLGQDEVREIMNQGLKGDK